MKKRTREGEPLAYYWANVDTATDECILWPYAQNGWGYGSLRSDGHNEGVHVLACEQAHGPRPHGMDACHSCRNRHCFNPRHLRWGTPTENCADRIEDGTVNHGERNGRAKLTERKVLEIRSRFHLGASLDDLATTYGVKPNTVYQIVVRRLWTHI